MKRVLISAVCLIMSVPAFAEEDHHHSDGDAGVKVERVSVVDGITMLQAGGGNVGVFTGDDGVFVIDSNLQGTGAALSEAIAEISSDKPVKFLVNTHWHFDHTGSNAHFHDNESAVIMAHDNVRKRLAAGQEIPALDKKVEAAESSALPVLTYSGATHLYLNGQSVEIIPVDPAHTDGDSFVYWPALNVVHTGDLFFNGFWPFIDTSSGGGINGMIAAVDKVLAISNDDTKIIPGHGSLADKSDLTDFRTVLAAVSERASAAKAAGKSLEAWSAEKPLADYDAEWGDGFLPTDAFISIVWDGI